MTLTSLRPEGSLRHDSTVNIADGISGMQDKHVSQRSYMVWDGNHSSALL